MAEKSEKATPKKLRDARKKGQVAKSQDFPSAFTFAASILLLVELAGFMYDRLGEYFVALFNMSTRADALAILPSVMERTLWLILEVSLPIAGSVALVGVLVNFLVVGPLWAAEAMKPDIKKLNPITGLRNKFKMKTLVELLKSIFKLTVAGYIVYHALWEALPTLIQTAGLPLMESAYIIASFFRKVALQVGLFFLAIAIFDLIYQRRVFAKEMKMEKFAVKQEHKDIEGSPEIKGRRRQIAQEIAYEEGPSAAKRARVVVTNPSHIAVAIAYQPEEYAAPYVVTLGIDHIADQIIRVAQANHIPIMRDPPLARQLFEEGSVMEYIPEETYDAVAEVLRWVLALEEDLT